MAAINDLMLEDGFSSLITMQLDPTIKLFEKTVTPPGYEGSGGIPITTMRNIRFETMAPKQLLKVGNLVADCAYASSIHNSIQNQMQVTQQITVSYPDGSYRRFWGFLDSFVPGALTIGEQPTATVTFVMTNRNASGVEEGPVWHDTDASGSAH